jgi:2-polyprenyl-3-methyl-5-hydroxy-6-metoxy-1,4-benzoquinol methylase
MAHTIESPVTGGPATPCDQFRCADLIDRYRNDWGLDVAAHFTGMDSLTLYCCKDTGYRFFHPPSLAGEAAFYDAFWALDDPHIHRPQRATRADWQFALEQIRKGERVLDVGCADGGFVELAGAIAHAEGIDENEKGCRLAQAKGLRVSCAAVTDFSRLHAAAFDTVTASQVLEHVYDVSRFVIALKQLVRPGGRIILSVPNNEPYYAGSSKYEPLNNPPHHIGLWNEGSLRRMAAHFDLTVDEVEHLGPSDRFTLQVYRRAALLAGVSKAPRQLAAADWLRIIGTAPLGLTLTLKERLTRSAANKAYLSIVLRKSGN